MSAVLARLTTIALLALFGLLAGAARAATPAPGDQKLLVAFKAANYGEPSGGFLSTPAALAKAIVGVAVIKPCTVDGEKAQQLMMAKLSIASLNLAFNELARQIEAKQSADPSYIASPAHVHDIHELYALRDEIGKLQRKSATDNRNLGSLIQKLENESCGAFIGAAPPVDTVKEVIDKLGIDLHDPFDPGYVKNQEQTAEQLADLARSINADTTTQIQLQSIAAQLKELLAWRSSLLPAGQSESVAVRVTCTYRCEVNVSGKEGSLMSLPTPHDITGQPITLYRESTFGVLYGSKVVHVTISGTKKVKKG